MVFIVIPDKGRLLWSEDEVLWLWVNGSKH